METNPFADAELCRGDPVSHHTDKSGATKGQNELPRVVKSAELHLRPAVESVCSCVCINDCSCDGTLW